MATERGMRNATESVQMATSRIAWSASESVPEAVNLADLDNDALILQLHMTVNHLSRWLSSVHDQRRLRRTPRRGQPSVIELVLRMRDEELRIFPNIFAISVHNQPNLDALATPSRSMSEARHDREASVIEQVAEFRRLRQSTCSLLRSLPNSAWSRTGISRHEHDWTIRGLAEHLIHHDRRVLFEMDQALNLNGAREGIATAAKISAEELLAIVPARRSS